MKGFYWFMLGFNSAFTVAELLAGVPPFNLPMVAYFAAALYYGKRS